MGLGQTTSGSVRVQQQEPEDTLKLLEVCGGATTNIRRRLNDICRPATYEAGGMHQLIPNVSYTVSSRSLYPSKMWGAAESPT